MKNNITCSICWNWLNGKQKLFCSLECKNKAHQSYSQQKERWLARKILLVKRLWAKCSTCGYRKNLSALAFHHKDGWEKDFKLDMRSLSNRTLSAIESELGKCILLCHNCHAEVHHPELDLDSPSLSRLL